eukprot:8220141-Pyramimonas_sp.AAC.1
MSSDRPFLPADMLSLAPVCMHAVCTSADGRATLEAAKYEQYGFSSSQGLKPSINKSFLRSFPTEFFTSPAVFSRAPRCENRPLRCENRPLRCENRPLRCENRPLRCENLARICPGGAGCRAVGGGGSLWGEGAEHPHHRLRAA